MQIEFSWFTDSSYLKGGNSKYHAGYAIETYFEVNQETFLPLPDKLNNSLIWACALAKDKTANIYTDSCYAFGVALDFGMVCKQQCFLPLMRLTLKIVMSKIYQVPYFQCPLWLLRTLGIPNHSLKAKGNHLADIFLPRTLLSKEPIAKLLSGSKRMFPQVVVYKN